MAVIGKLGKVTRKIYARNEELFKKYNEMIYPTFFFIFTPAKHELEAMLLRGKKKS